MYREILKQALLTSLFTPKEKRELILAAFHDNDVIRRKYVLSRICEHLEKNKFEPAPLLNKKLLDVGCGLSSIPGELVLRGALVTAIDRDCNTLSRARETAQKRGMDVIYINKYLEDFALDHVEKYDVILCLDVLDEVKHLAPFAAAADKLLADDGILIATGRSHNIIARTTYRILRKFRTKRTFPHRFNTVSRIFNDHNLKKVHEAGLFFNFDALQWEKTEKHRLRFMAAFTRSGKPHTGA